MRNVILNAIVKPDITGPRTHKAEISRLEGMRMANERQIEMSVRITAG